MREWCARGRWCACALLALLALTVAERDKRTENEMAPNPFMFVARYGRSSAPRVAPRNDRFFYPRYGKRSEGPRELTASERGPGGGPEECASDLLCEYTGVFPLYRCRHKVTRRNTEESGEELE